MNTESLITELYSGLQFMKASAFPKKCQSCGKVYDNANDFFIQTQSLRGKSGLRHSLDDDDKSLVELFRNCICGSTMMEECRDRRDTSEMGLRRREKFGQLLDLLKNSGIDAGIAREELLRVMRGEQSDVLHHLGVPMKIR
ncbi:MAG: oxidoreductase [Nitrospirae bacterium]|nr:oxidoreductase [Nitrospirota bacterium]